MYTDFESCIEYLKKDKERRDRYEKLLKEENEKLKSEAYKDEELAKIKAENDTLRQDAMRGFPISEKETKAISEWKTKHLAEEHHLETDTDRALSGGAAGGTFTYIFTPTSLGVIGTVKCSCGCEFTFRNIDSPDAPMFG